MEISKTKLGLTIDTEISDEISVTRDDGNARDIWLTVDGENYLLTVNEAEIIGNALLALVSACKA